MTEVGSYDWWTDALAERFFNTNFAGEPVMLCADEHELASVLGAASGEAVESLAAAARSRVMPGYHFARVKAACTRWKASDISVPPPSIPLLALSVLAATRMTVGDRGGAPNFYLAFRQLLDPEDLEVGIPGDFGDTIPAMWEQLSSWLSNDMGDSRGIPTITRHDAHPNMGYSRQQAIFRASDKRRLFRFFHAIGLEPSEEEVVPSELRRALAIWAKRQGQAGDRLHRLATDPTFERYSEDLLRILGASWDGRLRDEV